MASPNNNGTIYAHRTLEYREGGLPSKEMKTIDAAYWCYPKEEKTRVMIGARELVIEECGNKFEEIRATICSSTYNPGFHMVNLAHGDMCEPVFAVDNKNETLALALVINEWLADKNAERKRTLYIECEVKDLMVGTSHTKVLVGDDEVPYVIHDSWLPNVDMQVGGSIWVRRRVANPRGPKQDMTTVMQSSNVVDGKHYPFKMVQRNIDESGKLTEYLQPDMSATPTQVESAAASSSSSSKQETRPKVDLAAKVEAERVEELKKFPFTWKLISKTTEQPEIEMYDPGTSKAYRVGFHQNLCPTNLVTVVKKVAADSQVCELRIQDTLLPFNVSELARRMKIEEVQDVKAMWDSHLKVINDSMHDLIRAQREHGCVTEAYVHIGSLKEKNEEWKKHHEEGTGIFVLINNKWEPFTFSYDLQGAGNGRCTQVNLGKHRWRLDNLATTYNQHWVTTSHIRDVKEAQSAWSVSVTRNSNVLAKVFAFDTIEDAQYFADQVSNWLHKLDAERKEHFFSRCNVFSKGMVFYTTTRDIYTISEENFPKDYKVGETALINKYYLTAANRYPKPDIVVIENSPPENATEAVKAVKEEGKKVFECCGHKTENIKWADCGCVDDAEIDTVVREGRTIALVCPCVKSAFFNAQQDDDRRILEDQRQRAEKFTEERGLFDVDDFASLKLTYDFPRDNTASFYQQGKLRWSIETNGKRFQRHKTEVSRRLDINGENEVFVLSVHFNGQLIKDICCFKNFEKLKVVRDDLDYYLKKIDDTREKRKKEQDEKLAKIEKRELTRWANLQKNTNAWELLDESIEASSNDASKKLTDGPMTVKIYPTASSSSNADWERWEFPKNLPTADGRIECIHRSTRKIHLNGPKADPTDVEMVCVLTNPKFCKESTVTVFGKTWKASNTKPTFTPHTVDRNGSSVNKVTLRCDGEWCTSFEFPVCSDAANFQREVSGWLKYIDGLRNNLYYVKCAIAKRLDDGHVRLESLENGECFVVKTEYLPPFAKDAHTVVAPMWALVQSVPVEDDKPVASSSTNSESDELDKVCAELEDDEVVGQSVNHNGPGEIIEPPECRASSCAASSSKTEEEKRKEADSALLDEFPFPFSIKVDNYGSGEVRLILKKTTKIFSRYAWKPDTQNPLTLSLRGDGKANVILAFNIPYNYSYQSLLTFEFPQEKDAERLRQLWQVEVDALNEFARKAVANSPSRDAIMACIASPNPNDAPTDEQLRKSYKFPFRCRIFNALAKTITIVRTDSDVEITNKQYRSTKENPNVLTMNVIDLGQDTVTIAFPELIGDHKTPYDWVHKCIPTKIHKRVVAMWQEEVDKINEFARKLAEHDEPKAAPSSSSSFTPTPGTWGELAYEQAKEKIEQCVRLIEEQLPSNCVFRDTQHRSEVVEDVAKKCIVLVPECTSEDEWIDRWTDYAIEKVKKAMHETMNAKPSPTPESDWINATLSSVALICAEGLMRGVESDMDGPIYLVDEERDVLRREVAGRIARRMEETNDDSKTVHAETLAYVTAQIAAIQKRNTAKYNEMARAFPHSEFSRFAVWCGKCGDILLHQKERPTPEQVPHCKTCEKSDETAASSSSSSIETPAKSEEIKTVRCLTCSHVSEAENETPCRCQPSVEEDEEPEQVEEEVDPDVVKGESRYGPRLSFNRQTHTLRIGGRAVTLPKFEKGKPNDIPSVYTDTNSDDSRFLRIIVKYRGEEFHVENIEGSRDASLFCEDLGDWLMEHHNRNFLD